MALTFSSPRAVDQDYKLCINRSQDCFTWNPLTSQEAKYSIHQVCEFGWEGNYIFTLTLLKQLAFTFSVKGFPNSSVGKESTYSAGDPGSIPGSGRSAGEGIGYPLQYSWVSLVAQLVKNLPAVQETWVRSLGWEDPLEEGKATHFSILAWRIPWTV